jgi:hypothetical protein
MSRVFKPKPPPLQVGETLPAALDAKDLARAFGMSLHAIYDWHKHGKIRRFELRKPMGPKRWSGRLVQEFLDGGGSAQTSIRRAS